MLSVEGHRVLVTGSNFDNLQGLDVALCQSELHRFHALVTPRAVAEWVTDDADWSMLVLPERGGATQAPR